MKIIQLTSSDTGEPIGLYHTERKDEYVEQDIQNAFAEAIFVAEADDSINPHDHADDLLEALSINRVFADDVYIPNI